MYVCTSYVCSAFTGQKTMLDPLEAELKKASVWVLEIKPGPLEKQPVL